MLTRQLFPVWKHFSNSCVFAMRARTAASWQFYKEVIRKEISLQKKLFALQYRDCPTKHLPLQTSRCTLLGCKYVTSLLGEQAHCSLVFQLVMFPAGLDIQRKFPAKSLPCEPQSDWETLGSHHLGLLWFPKEGSCPLAVIINLSAVLHLVNFSEYLEVLCNAVTSHPSSVHVFASCCDRIQHPYSGITTSCVPMED